MNKRLFLDPFEFDFYLSVPLHYSSSSQTRDKSSNSRSASVESSRGVSPPREYGDYRHARTRASGVYGWTSEISTINA